MRENNPHLSKKSEQWLKFAEEDLQFAQYAKNMPSENNPYRLIAFHAQQCAEKSLKAFLVSHNRQIPYTHNIGILLEICATVLPSLAHKLKEAYKLSPYAITARYPVEDEEVDQRDALEAIRIAEKVNREILELLKDRD